ncbi:amino acid ABC transporter [Vibrio pectenicida]|uniref:amino acid ABC transporter n=1 Tax=Vibrio pectenicida TaxID=62763 RepID=UPI0020A4585B|nr:amino acid ABC transporter [Vibrio pectenicida]
MKTTEQLFSMLELKRLPVIALQDTTAQQFLLNHEILTIKQIQPAIKTKDYFLVLSHKFIENNSQIAQNIWQKIEDTREEIVQNQGPNYFNYR